MEISKRAFTLIELMIVVTIMGLLASVSVSGFAKYKRQAKKAEAYVTTGNIIKAQKSFYIENQRFATDGLLGAALLGTMLGNFGTSYSYSAFMASQWDELGAPFAEGAIVRWFYQSGHGEYDSSGNHTSGWEVGAPILYIDADGDSSCAGGTGSGTSSITPVDFGAPAAPAAKYDYATSVAFSPLTGRLQTSDIWITSECYYVLQYLSVDGTNNGVFQESPIIEFGYSE